MFWSSYSASTCLAGGGAQGMDGDEYAGAEPVLTDAADAAGAARAARGDA
jgi:hypothetical protein